MYGWRGKIGLVAPSTNTVCEPEFHRLAPEGVAIYTSRAHLREADSPAEKLRVVQEMNDSLVAAAVSVASVSPQVIAFACTTGGFCSGPGTGRPLEEAVERATGIPTIGAATAVAQAMKRLGMKRITMVTPYFHEIAAIEKEYMESAVPGLKIAVLHNLNIGPNLPKGRFYPWETYRLVREVDTEETDGVFISCCNWRSIEIIEALERSLQKPVITSIQATFWAVSRVLGLPDISGYGRLLSSTAK